MAYGFIACLVSGPLFILTNICMYRHTYLYLCMSTHSCVCVEGEHVYVYACAYATCMPDRLYDVEGHRGDLTADTA